MTLHDKKTKCVLSNTDNLAVVGEEFGSSEIPRCLARDTPSIFHTSWSLPLHEDKGDTSQTC